MADTLTLIEKTVFLKSIDMLSSIPTEALAQIASKAHEVQCEAGDVVFREGDPDQGSFLVIEGLIELRKQNSVVRALKERQAHGELFLSQEEPHQYTAVALRPSHLLNIEREDVTDALVDYPEFGLAMVRASALQVHRLTQRVLDLEARLERYEPAQPEGRPPSDGGEGTRKSGGSTGGGALPVLLIAPLLAVMGAGAMGCGSSIDSAAIADTLRVRLESLQEAPMAVRGERLVHPKALASFYRERKSKRAWPARTAADQIVRAIQDVERDGLTPSDYHLETIQSLLQEREKSSSPALESDLDLLLTDAVAGIVDHVRYGRVQPIKLDARWNVDPREGAPPLEQAVAEIASSSSVSRAMEAARPQHFIYRGLVGALARLKEIVANGGWPTLPPGRSIKPGATDPRLPVIRRRLVVSGELSKSAAADSARYDAELLEAVKLFQARHRLDTTGTIDAGTIEAMNVSAQARVGQVRVNLERARWVINGLQEDFLLVNLPAFKAYLIRGGTNVWETRTQIGKEARQTPSFRSDMSSIVFNPDWTVPPTILAEDVLEGMRKGENVIAKKKLVILDGEGQEVDPGAIDWGSATPETFRYTLRQPPGADNALGRVKFLFPNRYSIYLHDTPSQELFEADHRTFSSGCIRVEKALELAPLLLEGQEGWTPERINQVVEAGRTLELKLARPLPVLIVYWTVSVGASGEIRYMRDVYEHDPAVLAAVDR